MKLLYGTANRAKLEHMREMLKGLDIDIIGIDQVDLNNYDVDETGSNPLENARQKALTYYEMLGRPVFSCDSGLFIEGLERDKQPGVHVRRVNGERLNDDDMIEHYSNMAKSLGGTMKARYKNAICLILDEENIIEYDGEDISYEEFLITSKPHEKRIEGFPLDSLSVEIETGKYFFDLEGDGYGEINITSGFRNFFEKNIF